ncbi:hypothetical protein ACQP3D_27670, partial [Escherichia coli]
RSTIPMNQVPMNWMIYKTENCEAQRETKQTNEKINLGFKIVLSNGKMFFNGENILGCSVKIAIQNTS